MKYQSDKTDSDRTLQILYYSQSECLRVRVEMSCVEMENEEKRKHDLRQLTKTFFGLEKPLLQKYTNVVSNLEELTKQLHIVFSSDSVNIE